MIKRHTRIARILATATCVVMVMLSFEAFAKEKKAEDIARPKVLSVSPENGAKDVPTRTEIRVIFDQPMNPNCVSLNWKVGYSRSRGFDLEGGYREAGIWRYDASLNEFIIPLVLEAGCRHEITVNSALRDCPEGFKSVGGIATDTYSWSFTTQPVAVSKDAPQPQVKSVSPEPGSETCRATVLKVAFDQPMNPYTILYKPIGNETDLFKSVGFCPIVEYNPTLMEFSVPLFFPASERSKIQVGGFLSEKGVASEPIELTYTATKKLLSDEILERFAKAKQNPELKDLLLKIQNARKSLKSISEKAISITMNNAPGRFGPLRELTSKESTFKMQGDRQCYGDISDIMKVPFIIACDGETCWWYIDIESKPNALTSCSYDTITEKQVSICDPFYLLRKDVDAVISDSNIEYIGVVDSNGHQAHLIQTWNTSKDPNAILTISRWYIDAETLLPLEVCQFFSLGSECLTRFTYESINKEIPASEFSSAYIKDASSEPLKPLKQGYDTRILNVIDASATGGRMSVRWGESGSAGTSSSGLN